MRRVKWIYLGRDGACIADGIPLKHGDILEDFDNAYVGHNLFALAEDPPVSEPEPEEKD